MRSRRSPDLAAARPLCTALEVRTHMAIAEIILKYIEALIWPIVAIFIAIRFNSELRGLLGKALDSHEVEIDVLGQKVKLKALEKITSEISNSQEIEDSGPRQHNNDFVALYFARLISSLSTHEVMMLRRIAREIRDDGYVACEAERPAIQRFVEENILQRDERGFYIPTGQGKKLLYTLKNL